MIGILGGMGPEAGARLVLRVAQVCCADADQEHPEVLYYSMSRVPDRTAAIMNGGPSPAGAMQQGIDLLVSCGVGVLGIACNTAHHWLASLDIPIGVRVVDIVDAVCTEIYEIHASVDAAMILSTAGTRRARIFERLAPLRTVYPTDDVQAVVERIISQLKGGDRDSAQQLLSETLQSLHLNDSWVVVLGCTELSLIWEAVSATADLRVVDSVDALARELVRATGRPVRNDDLPSKLNRTDRHPGSDRLRSPKI